MYLNKVIVIGNITRDVELKVTSGGMKVANFSVATNRVWKDKNGARQESADYHNIVVFGNTAENVAKYMSKGSQIMIEGRLQTRSWEAQDGTKRYTTEIIAENVQFGNNKNNNNQSSSKPAQKQNDDEIEYPDEPQINAEDIPF